MSTAAWSSPRVRVGIFCAGLDFTPALARISGSEGCEPVPPEPDAPLPCWSGTNIARWRWLGFDVLSSAAIPACWATGWATTALVRDRRDVSPGLPSLARAAPTWLLSAAFSPSGRPWLPGGIGLCVVLSARRLGVFSLLASASTRCPAPVAEHRNTRHKIAKKIETRLKRWKSNGQQVCAYVCVRVHARDIRLFVYIANRSKQSKTKATNATAGKTDRCEDCTRKDDEQRLECQRTGWCMCSIHRRGRGCGVSSVQMFRCGVWKLTSSCHFFFLNLQVFIKE